MWTILLQTIALTLLVFYALAIRILFRTARIQDRRLRQREVGALLAILGAGLAALSLVWGNPPIYVWMPVACLGYYLIYRGNAQHRSVHPQPAKPRPKREIAAR